MGEPEERTKRTTRRGYRSVSLRSRRSPSTLEEGEVASLGLAWNGGPRGHRITLNTSRSRQKVAPKKGSPDAVLVTVVDTARLARVV